MKSIPIPSVRWISRKRLRICACTETSRAETASSQIRSDGSSAIARAMLTRWSWPPESLDGFRLADRLVQPDGIEQLGHARPPLRFRAAAVDPQRLCDRPRDGLAPVEGEERFLEDRLELGRSSFRRRRDAPSSRSPMNRTSPLLGESRPRARLATVDLPDPDSPTSPTTSPAPTSKVTSAQATTGRPLAANSFLVSRNSSSALMSASSPTGARWHATSTPATGRSAGGSIRQRSTANEQRFA